MLPLPLGDTFAAGIEAEAVRGGLGNPRADRRALGGGRDVDER